MRIGNLEDGTLVLTITGNRGKRNPGPFALAYDAVQLGTRAVVIVTQCRSRKATHALAKKEVERMKKYQAKRLVEQLAKYEAERAARLAAGE